MRLLVGALLLVASSAAAQPAEPQPPGPAVEPAPAPSGDPGVPPADGTAAAPADSSPTWTPGDTPTEAEQAAATEAEQAATNEPRGRVSYAWGPLDAEGWPRGFAQEDLRGLPECGPEGLPRVYGAPITCRPHLTRFAPAWSIGFDLTTGATWGDVATAGGAHGWGIDTHFALSRNFQLGARYEMLGVSVARMPGEGEHAEMAQHALVSAKLRLWTDEAARNALTLGGGAGIAIHSDALGGVAPMWRASLAREVGLFFKRHASLLAFELAYERTLDERPMHAVLASFRGGAEVNVIAPRNIDERATPTTRTTSFHMLLSAWWGFGIGTGLPIAGPLSWETTGDFLTNVTSDHPIFRGYHGAQWSARTGLRVDAGIFYLLGQAGLSWYAHDPKGELDRVAHGEAGFNIGRILRIGGWLRWNLDDTFDSAGLVFTFVTGGGRWGARVPRLELEHPWVGIAGGGGRVDANVGVDVGVEVQVEPVVIEVPLGASVFGVGVSIDPRILPIDKLQRAGFVQVELSGPSGALSDFRAQLSGTLDARGVHVDGWSTVETGAGVVRAKFTIWPPGTRPPP